MTYRQNKRSVSAILDVLCCVVPISSTVDYETFGPATKINPWKIFSSERNWQHMIVLIEVFVNSIAKNWKRQKILAWTFPELQRVSNSLGWQFFYRHKLFFSIRAQSTDSLVSLSVTHRALILKESLVLSSGELGPVSSSRHQQPLPLCTLQCCLSLVYSRALATYM